MGLDIGTFRRMRSLVTHRVYPLDRTRPVRTVTFRRQSAYFRYRSGYRHRRGLTAGIVPVPARVRRALRAARDRARGQRGHARPPGSSGAAPATGCTAATPPTRCALPEHGLEPVVLVPGFMAGDGTLGADVPAPARPGLPHLPLHDARQRRLHPRGLRGARASHRDDRRQARPQGHDRRAQPRRPDGPRPRRPAPRPRRRHRHAGQPDPRARCGPPDPALRPAGAHPAAARRPGPG